MRIVDLYIRPADADKAEQLARDAGHRVVRADNGELTHLRVVVAIGSPDEFLEGVDKAVDLEADDETFMVVTEPMGIQPRDEEKAKEHERVAAREEIVTTSEQGTRLSRTFFVLATTSALIATGGLLMSNVAVVVGAMVIAPVFQPLVGVATGVAIGRPKLALLGARSISIALLIAFVVGALLTLLTPLVHMNESLSARADLHIYDILVALGAGAAAGYTITRNDRTAFIGIVVAASIVPTACAMGIGLADGQFDLLRASAITVGANVVSVVVAIVLVFQFERLRAADAIDKKGGERMTRLTIGVGTAVLVVLTGFVAWTLWRGLDDRRREADFERVLASELGSEESVLHWEYIPRREIGVVYTIGTPDPGLMRSVQDRLRPLFDDADRIIVFVAATEVTSGPGAGSDRSETVTESESPIVGPESE